MIRRVIVSRLERPEGQSQYVKNDVGEAVFHGFGVGFEELSGGVGNYTTAIIEWASGRVEEVPADMIRFVVPTVQLPKEPARVWLGKYWRDSK